MSPEPEKPGRDSAATGVPLHVVLRRLGHASEAPTAQVYADVLPQQGEHAAAPFADLVAHATDASADTDAADAAPDSVRELCANGPQ